MELYCYCDSVVTLPSHFTKLQFSQDEIRVDGELLHTCEVMRVDSALLAGGTTGSLLAMAAHTLVRSGADMASAQIVLGSPDSLALVAYPGFSGAFVEHFAIVSAPQSACGRAFAAKTAVEVTDIAADAVFTPYDKRVLLDAGVASVTSIPVTADDGRIVGIISAHFRTPGHHDTTFAEVIAARVGEHIERAASLP
jgi:GAF domain-containing protein